MKKYFMLIVLLIGVLSCRIDKAGSYEMKVFNEIFDNLVEEMGALSSFEIPPPIPFLDNNNPIAYDTVGYDKKIVEIERKNRKMRDTTFVIAVFDSAATIFWNEWNLACSSRSGNFNDVCCSSGVSFYPAREKKCLF